MKDMQTEQPQCWSGMTDTEHSATSGSTKKKTGQCEEWKNNIYCEVSVIYCCHCQFVDQTIINV